MGFWIFACMLVIGLTITGSIYIFNFQGFKDSHYIERRIRELEDKIIELENRLKGE